MNVYRRLKGGKCTCHRKPCTCPRYPTYSALVTLANGRRVIRSTGLTDKALAEKWARNFNKGLKVVHSKKVFAFFESLKKRDASTSFGALFQAFVGGDQHLASEFNRDQCVLSMRRVLAYAFDLWTTHQGGVKGVRVGDLIPDTAKIDELSLNQLAGDKGAETVRAYYLASTGLDAIDWREPVENARTINSRLNHARSLFSQRAISLKYEPAGILLPDVSKFRSYPSLPTHEASPEPLSAVEFAAMMSALPSASPEIRLINRLLRQTGLRSSYVVALHQSWLSGTPERPMLDIRNRVEPRFKKKPRTRDQLIPLTSATATAIRLACSQHGGFLLDQATADRLVNREHNAWLKGACRLTSIQGNHRLRDTVASALWTLCNPQSAQNALGHADPATTAKHYAKLMPHVSELVKTELSAWL